MGAKDGSAPLSVSYPAKSWITVNPCPAVGTAAKTQSADTTQAIFSRPKPAALSAFQFRLDLHASPKVLSFNIGELQSGIENARIILFFRLRRKLIRASTSPRRLTALAPIQRQVRNL